MPSRTDHSLAQLQQEFAEKLREYDSTHSPTVSTIAMNIETMERYGMSPLDYIQLGPFSCREILEPLKVDLKRLKENKALIFGFLADTFLERGFNVNVYNVVPETGAVEVQNVPEVLNHRKADIQLSTWDKFWAFFGIETANVKTAKGFEDAKKREAQAATAMRAAAEAKAAEVKKIAAFVPKDLSRYPREAAAIFKDLERGDYNKAMDRSGSYLKKTFFDKAREVIHTKNPDNDTAKISSLFEDFKKKYFDEKFNRLSLEEKVFTLTNIIKTPALLDEVCKVNAIVVGTKTKKVVKATNTMGKLKDTGKTVEVPVYQYKISDAVLADYTPDLSDENVAQMIADRNAEEPALNAASSMGVIQEDIVNENEDELDQNVL